MYSEFFKLSRKPFGTTPDPDFFYVTTSLRQTCDRLISALQKQEHCLLLSGEPGTGKTALLNYLIKKENSEFFWICIHKAPLAWIELQVLVARELEIDLEDDAASSLDVRITEKIAGLKDQGLHPVLIIDEADHCSIDTLRQILTWQASLQTRKAPLSIVLAGLERIHQTYSATEQAHFSRPAVHCILERFDPEATKAVIAYRLEMAGYSGPELFGNEAVELIYHLSGGVPRVINLICGLSLALAANQNRRQITPDILHEASEHLLLDSRAGKSGRKQSTPSATSLVNAAGDENHDQATASVEAPPSSLVQPPGRKRKISRLWTAIGLGILLAGAGTWILSALPPTMEQGGARQPLIFQAPVNNGLEGVKMPVPRFEPASQNPITTEVARTQDAGCEPRAVPGVATEEKKPAVRSSLGDDLIEAVVEGNQKKARQLIAAGASINSITASGETPLMKAAWAGDTAMTTLLLSYKPRVNSQSLEGWTPLFYAAVKGHKSVVETLLSKGARVDIADQDGRTPLMAAVWNGHTGIAELLLRKNADPNRKNREGWTPLMFAALKGDVKTARILLRHDADPEIRNKQGKTSARLATDQGHSRFPALLSSYKKRG